MRRIIIDIIIACIATTVICAVIIRLFYCYIPNQYETNYVSSMWDKYNRLVSIDEPKIVLIGDSNLAFGIDSEYLEQELGMPVVNMGLHGGLGNDVQTRIALSNVRKGDIYVIAYSDYGQTECISQKDLTLVMLAGHAELWKCLSLYQKYKLLSAIPSYMFDSMSLYIRGRGNEDIESRYSDYSRKAFNVYGDNAVRIEGNELTDFRQFSSRITEISDETVDLIKWCKDMCEEKEATVVIAAYPIMITKEMDSVEVYQNFFMELQERTGCYVISDSGRYMMSTDMFYDTQLHLKSEGVKRRTKELKSDIERYIVMREE